MPFNLVDDYSIKVQQAKTFLGFSPTADVVEVVRCKDCKECDHCYPIKNKGEKAREGYYCDYYKRWVNPSDYCSYGERRDTK